MTRGLNAKNLEQNAAIDALLNPEKTLVCLLGPAGTGKTLLAIGAAIHHTRTLLPQNAGKAPEGEGKEERLTRRQRKQLRTQEEKLASGQETERLQIYITRPQVSMGKEMGFLPGGIDDKMDPWLQPIYDNLDQIVGQQARQKMIRDGAIKLQPLPYIRGRSLVNALLIVDESQNLTPHEVKTIITRAGRGTRIILTGDPDQIDNPYVDRLSNGLTYAADRLGREDFTAVVPLVQGERSPMSARAAELL
jgi:PhoH-like ATPase